MSRLAGAPDTVEDGDVVAGNSYVPLADLLTGLVFILVIIITAISVTTRRDFEAERAVEARMQQLREQSARLDALEAAIIEPRRAAFAANAVLLARLRDDLAAAGVTAIVDEARATLTLAPGAGADRAALDALASALARRLPCVAPDLPPPADLACGDLQGARLARLVLIAPAAAADADALAAASAEVAVAYGRLIERAPALVRARDRGNQPLIGFSGRLDPRLSGFTVAVDMERPPQPPTNWLNELQP